MLRAQVPYLPLVLMAHRVLVPNTLLIHTYFWLSGLNSSF